jgi:hypothetical protein
MLCGSEAYTISVTKMNVATTVAERLKRQRVSEKVRDCVHKEVHEIGLDIDKAGKLLRIERCQRCGLLMREYLPD